MAGFSSVLDGLAPLPDTIICVVGAMGEQRRAETEASHAAEIRKTPAP
jgi:hypothetical protein